MKRFVVFGILVFLISGCVTTGGRYESFKKTKTLDECAQHGEKILPLTAAKALLSKDAYSKLAQTPEYKPYVEEVETAYKTEEPWRRMSHSVVNALHEYSSCGFDNRNETTKPGLKVCAVYAQLAAGTLGGIIDLKTKQEVLNEFKGVYEGHFPEGEEYISSLYDKVYNSKGRNNVGRALSEEVLKVVVCINKEGKI